MRPESTTVADLLTELGPFDGEVPDPDDEPWDDLLRPRNDRRITHVIAGTRDAAIVVWTQKIRAAEWIWPTSTPPAHVVGHYGPPDDAAIDLVASRLAPSRVVVLTDLDPWGWFLAQIVVRAFAARGVAAVHRGIDDALIALSTSWRRQPAPDDALLGLTIASSLAERARWAWLRPHAAESLGPRARAVLDSGRRLELEAVTNPSLYREGHAEALGAWLLDGARGL